MFLLSYVLYYITVSLVKCDDLTNKDLEEYQLLDDAVTEEYCYNKQLLEQQVRAVEQCDYLYLEKYSLFSLLRLYCEEKFTTSALQRRDIYCSGYHEPLGQSIRNCTKTIWRQIGCDSDRRPNRCDSRHLDNMISEFKLYRKHKFCVAESIDFNMKQFKENIRANERLHRAYSEFCNLDTFYNNKTINSIMLCGVFAGLFDAASYYSCYSEHQFKNSCDEEDEVCK